MKRLIFIPIACVLAAFVVLSSIVLISYVRQPASPFGIKRGMSLAEVQACVGRAPDKRLEGVGDPRFDNFMTIAEWEPEGLQVMFTPQGTADTLISAAYSGQPPPTLFLLIQEWFYR